MRRLLGIGALGLIVIAIAGGAVKHGSPTKSGRCGESTMAYVMSQHWIEDRLLSPGSAEFPWADEVKITVPVQNPNDKQPCRYVISAYVDAQNGFGALLRHRYHATMTDHGDDSWSASDIELFE